MSTILYAAFSQRDTPGFLCEGESECHSAGQHKAMVIAVVTGGCNLHRAAEHQPEPACWFASQLNATNHHPWSQKRLILTVIRASMKVTGIDLELRPEMFAHFVLSDRVPGDCSANGRR